MLPNMLTGVTGYIQPRDCYDVMAGGANSSGIYTIFIGPTNNTLLPLSVYCDMETDGGGWTVRITIEHCCENTGTRRCGVKFIDHTQCRRCGPTPLKWQWLTCDT